ncbi:hypothetical protein Sam112_gp65 [Bacillus phage vB_BcM_Sam112]|uniref:DUF8096 domain-containing protein n=1 Tax=Bacillus phage vB_BcM_Sam112 TaxID=2663324 RepID=A0A5Q2F7B1_9CAUD|nr:hypothetical protein Sam112_gp65 [Bacillus phage vB_BcM_Sam112]
MSKRIDSVWLQNFKKEEAQEIAAAPVKKAGVCDTCNKGAFTLRMHEHQMLRLCKNCKELYNPDTDKVIRKGAWENVKGD